MLVVVGDVVVVVVVVVVGDIVVVVVVDELEYLFQLVVVDVAELIERKSIQLLLLRQPIMVLIPFKASKQELPVWMLLSS